MGTVDGKLFALDADSGKPCNNFADNGILDLNQWNTINAKYPLSVLQPPTVVGNHLLIGCDHVLLFLERGIRLQ